MGKTPIQWAAGSADGREGHSINPFRAYDKAAGPTHFGHFCEKIGPECKYCYSSKLQIRFRMYEFVAENRDKVVLVFDKTKIDEVIRRKKPTGYFWCDMTDMFLDDYPFEWIEQCFDAMAQTPQHLHMVLTKRPERMREFVDWWIEPRVEMPPNIFLGVSVGVQPALGRIDTLKDIPAAVRFISFEPLLEDLGAVILDGIHWAIIGGESGPKARPCDVAWIRSIRGECFRQNVACFVKQLGSEPTGFSGPVGDGLGLVDSKGGDPAEWPNDLRVREYPSPQIVSGV